MGRVIFFALCVLAANWIPVKGQAITPESNSVQNGASAKAAVAADPNATIMLKVSIIEISTTKLRQQGIDFDKLLAGDVQDSSAAKKKTADGDVDLFGEANPGRAGCTLYQRDAKVFSTVKALVKEKLASIRAQPCIMAPNGRAASFLSGGQFPVPVPQSAGTIAIEWKSYGTKIDFVPVMLDQDTIRLEIRARFSLLDENHSIKVADTSIPGLTVITDIDTAFKMKTDQIAILSGGTRSRAVENSSPATEKKDKAKADAAGNSSPKTCEEFTTLLLIKPEIVEPAK